LWAWAKYDFGLTWEEFEELTPLMFLALCKRRNVAIRYERYANAQTAAAVYNVNRHSADDPIVRPFDFVMTDEQAFERDQLLTIKQFFRSSISHVPRDCPRSKFLEVRANCIRKLTQQGRMDAEQIFDSMYPSLVPTEEKQV